MYLSNRDIKWAIDSGQLIVRPRPEDFGAGYDETSIDLHLAGVDTVRVWDLDALRAAEEARASGEPEVHIGRFNWGKFSERYLIPLPKLADLPPEKKSSAKVFRRGDEAVIKPGGFLLWLTREWVETPAENPTLICFVDGKSTRARTGILVHLTAPTIHSGWGGQITLEIANVGPFHFVLQENDVIAQLTVATISSPPDLSLKKSESSTRAQRDVSGRPSQSGSERRQRRRSGGERR